MKDYFYYLDKDKNGTVSIEDLTEPLLTLGVNREEIREFVEIVDRTGKGEIKLEDFLTLIKSARVAPNK